MAHRRRPLEAAGGLLTEERVSVLLLGTLIREPEGWELFINARVSVRLLGDVPTQRWPVSKQ